ncbi:MAG: glycosyltransferase family 39 protein [Candidatus Giovannonibacteria bacterium]|nr:glycosyltransferase family 39 protein [Candidatus Giovannonibacteria bacterium]
MNGTNTIQALEGDEWKVFYPENFGREGLFINIQALFVKTLGHESWVLRLPSAIFGLFTVLGLYFLTKELFSERIALFSAFFLATSFWHINFSRMGFRAIMAPFFLVWAFNFLFLGMRKLKQPFFVLAGLFFGLGAHSYIAYRVAPLIALLPLWKFYRNWQNSNPKEVGLPNPNAVI